jgi:hypothetical protein
MNYELWTIMQNKPNQTQPQPVVGKWAWDGEPVEPLPMRIFFFAIRYPRYA